MGQAKSRGTYEERVAQASERKRAAYLKQCEDRAKRQQAKSDRVREARESNDEPVLRRGAPSRRVGMMALMGAIALVAAPAPPATVRDKEDELSKLARKMRY